MHYLPVPKILKWPSNLSQHYEFDRKILITSGCSFTACTMTLDCAASWPGYVRDRGGFDLAIDMSCPGAGNRYIHDSIVYALEHLIDDPNQCMVMVMWSGLDRLDTVRSRSDPAPDPKDVYGHGMDLGDKTYYRCVTNPNLAGTTDDSRDFMLALHDRLQDQDIPYASCMYANLLWPPFVPKRDTTHHFQDYLSAQDIDHLQQLPWTVMGNDSLYEWALLNDYLDSGDFFHPPTQANLRWTDEVWLPAMRDKHLCGKLTKE